MFNFTPEEERSISEIRATNAVSIENIKRISDTMKPVRLLKDNDIRVARFGIRFCTRVLFRLRDTVHDMGDYYVLTNTYFLDFIDDISLAATKMHLNYGISVLLDKETPIPTNNNFMCYRFNKEDVDLDAELTGVVFGNTVRRLVAIEQKMLYSKAFLSTFFQTFPYVVPTSVAKVLFNVFIDVDSELTEDEKELVERWNYITKN